MPDDTRGATEAFEDRVVEDQSAEIRLTYEELAKFKAFLTQSGATEVSIGGHYLVVLDSNALAEMKSVRNELVHWGAPDAAQRSVLVEQLLRLMSVIDEVQAEHADAARPALLKAMLSADIDPIPSATIAQARRLAQQRERLLASGAYTIEALRDLRGDATPSATRTWLTRKRKAGELFTVTHDGAALVPAFQIDREAQPRPELVEVLQALVPAELSAWATWTWFTAGSAWLGGAIPADLLDSEPGRVATAARRFASNAA